MSFATIDVIDSKWNWGSSEPSLQTAINNAGFSTSVKYDKLGTEVFGTNGTALGWDFTKIFQYAGYAADSRVGYYDPNAHDKSITWVIGGANTGLGSSNSGVIIDGEFGLALDNGHGKVFYSQPALNWGMDNARVFVAEGPTTLAENDYLVAFEDTTLWFGDRDFNDFGLRLTGSEAVPEPATIFALATGAAVLLRRRQKKNS